MNIKKASGKGKKWMVTELGRCVLSPWGFGCAIAQKRILEWRWGESQRSVGCPLARIPGQTARNSFLQLSLPSSLFFLCSQLLWSLLTESSSCTTQPGKLPTPAYHLHPPPLLPEVVLAHCHPCCSWPGSVASSESQSTHFLGH